MCIRDRWQSLRAAMTGIYYSNVTPGATGGQPMEMYCLHKYGVSIGVSGSGMAVKFIVFQVVLLVTGAVLWIAHGGFVDVHTQGSKWFILMGYAVSYTHLDVYKRQVIWSAVSSPM